METQNAQTIDQVVTEIRHAEAASGGHLVWTGEQIESRTVVDYEHGTPYVGVVIAARDLASFIGDYLQTLIDDGVSEQAAYEIAARDLLAEDAQWRDRMEQENEEFEAQRQAEYRQVQDELNAHIN